MHSTEVCSILKGALSKSRAFQNPPTHNHDEEYKHSLSRNWNWAWLEQTSLLKRDLWHLADMHEGYLRNGWAAQSSSGDHGRLFSSYVLRFKHRKISPNNALHVWMERSVLGSPALMDCLTFNFGNQGIVIPQSHPLGISSSDWWLSWGLCVGRWMHYIINYMICMQLSLGLCIFRLKTCSWRWWMEGLISYLNKWFYWTYNQANRLLMRMSETSIDLELSCRLK